MNVLVPALLDRGDPAGREFALKIAELAETPEMLAALRDFALGQQGPDKLRIQAVQAAQHGGLLPSGKVRVWAKGKWHDTLLLGFEVHREAVTRHTPRVEALARRALELLSRGEGAEAEELLRQALELSPDSPDLLNNLAAAFECQGRTQEMEELVRDILRRFPDYFFVRANTAKMRARDGNIDEARELLKPLLERRRLHLAEFAALCMAEIEVAILAGEIEAARSWADMWEEIDPDNPQLRQLRRKLSGSWALGRMLGLRR
jgi:tetratricopeptide (TPR) repeat protein